MSNNTMTVVPQHDAIIATDVGFAYGAKIVSLYCADEEHYNRLPQAIAHDGQLCTKVSFHNDVCRAKYRSIDNNLVVKPVDRDPSAIKYLSTEECIAGGYLVRRKSGVMTEYLPTDKYRAIFKEIKNSDEEVIVSSAIGTVAYTKENLMNAEVDMLLMQYSDKE